MSAIFFLVSATTGILLVPSNYHTNSAAGQLEPTPPDDLASADISRNTTSVLGGGEEEEPAVNASVIVDANNHFALDFYSRLASGGSVADSISSNANIFFSPWSISNAFAIAYEGTRGNTAEEMESIFYFPKNADQRRSSFLKINDEMGISNNNNAIATYYTLSIANALWVLEGYKISDQYLNITKQYYNSEVANIDLTSIEGINTINKWVESKTNGKIKELLPPEAAGLLTRLAITSAVYFNGTWAEPFDESNTEQEDFKVSAGNTVKVPMMKLEETYLNYAETEQLQILEMPYLGERLSMLVFLPKNNNISSSIESLEQSLTLENLTQWKNKLSPELVTVHMPKFKLDTDYDLVDMLKEMGMPSAFTPNVADFSGITENDTLNLEVAVHKAFVYVNEKGTEAAAATGLTDEALAAPPDAPPVYLFRADHPFIFMIEENETGNILFLGKIVEPMAVVEQSIAE